MKLLALLVLLSALASLTVMEVVKDFRQKCPRFFLPGIKDRRIIPTVLTGKIYKQICQFYEGEYRFATLYDTEKKIPVYSAYTFYKTGEKGNRTGQEKGNQWLNEPQLEDQNSGKEMKLIEEQDNYTHQAVNKDYNQSGYTRGHVYPRGYTSDNDQSDSTFTLTNIAPQREASNREWSRQVEQPMRRVIEQNCRLSVKTPAYIVTGVVPGKRWIEIKRRGNKPYPKGVNIPSHYWSAFCCTNARRILVSGAYIAQQNNKKDPPAVKKTVKDLNQQLSTLYDTTNYSVFGNYC